MFIEATRIKRFTRYYAAAGAFVAASFGAFGDTRFQMVAFANERQVKGAQVCFFKGRGPDDFLARFFMSGDVRCYSADETIRLPTGYWNYYAEKNPGLVSAHPLGISSGTVLEERVKPMRVELLPSATIDLQSAMPALRADEYFAFYLTNEGQSASRPAVKPVVHDATAVVIPANMRVVPLIAHDESIVWVGQPLALRPGETVQLPPPQRPGTNIAAIITLDTTVSSQDRMAAEGAKPPTVRLVHDDVARTASFSLRTAPVFDGSLVLFEDVPPGDYTVEVTGDFWQSDSLPVRALASRSVVPMPARSLVTRPLGRLEVAWSIPAALEKVLTAPDCSASDKTTTGSTLTARRCIFGFDRSTPRDCVAEKTITLKDTLGGTESFPKLVSGEYYAELAHGGVKIRVRVPVRPAQTTRTTVSLEPSPITGRVTRGSRPVRAQIQFVTGTAMSDPDTGEYFAFVNGPPGPEPVVVTPCDTGKPFVDVPTKVLKADSRYDIEIPPNALDIKVVDADTARPLRGAHVTSRLMTMENTVPVRDLGLTDESGTISDDSLSPSATFELCASLPDYEVACNGNVQPTAERKSVMIAVKKSTARTVEIVSPSAVGFGRVYVVLNATIIGTANIEHHNQVRIEASTPPTAYLFLAAHNYPLIRLNLPNLSDVQPTLTLPPPVGAPVSITLAAASKHRGGPFTIGMGGVPIPRQILQYYQLIHNGDVLQIRNGETVTVGPIDGSLPLSVYLWYWAKDAPFDTHGADPFETISILQRMYVQPIVGGTVVIAP